MKEQSKKPSVPNLFVSIGVPTGIGQKYVNLWQATVITIEGPDRATIQFSDGGHEDLIRTVDVDAVMKVAQRLSS